MSKKSRELEKAENVNYYITNNNTRRNLRKVLEQSREEGCYEVAKNLLAIGMPLGLVKEVTKPPDLNLTINSLSTI